MRARIRWYLPALLLFLHSLAAQAQTGGSERLTAAQWRDDFRFVVTAIKTIHPRPFHQVPERVFDSTARAVEAGLARRSDRENVVALMGLVALVRDAHTSLRPGGKVFRLDRGYPIRIDRLPGGIFVVAAAPRYKDLLGDEVRQIGGRPAATVWDNLEAISPGDNAFSRMAAVPIWLGMPELMTAMHLGSAEGLGLEVRDENGASRTVRVEAVPAAFDYYKLDSGDAPGDASVRLPGRDPAVDELPLLHSADIYWFTLDRSSGFLYAQMNAVQNADRPVWLDGTEAKATVAQFAERVLGLVDSGLVRTVVIDLRRNPGGNNNLVVPFVNGIAARPAINQRGKLFVVTGRRTYSAAMNFTSLLEDRTQALFVGEPPGGSPSHYGDASGFVLPHSGLRLNVSTLHWDLGVRPTDVREVMDPDIAAPPRIADLRSGRDGPLAAIKNWRPGTILSEELLQVYKDRGLDSAIAVARRAVSTGDPAPWASRSQQLTKFGYGLVRSRASGPDIYRAFDLATELYPESADAWFERGRVYAFSGRWRDVEFSYAKAHALRPTNDLISRMLEVAHRQAAALARSKTGTR
ncbi:MAG: hypothetical protein ABI647_06460 [Gemmatimonadota bacterium]